MDGFRTALAFIVALAGFCIGAYVGLVEFLVGGIVQVVDGAKADPTNGEDIAWGLVKALFLWEAVWSAITFAGAAVAWLIWPHDTRSVPRGAGRAAWPF